MKEKLPVSRKERATIERKAEKKKTPVVYEAFRKKHQTSRSTRQGRT